MTFSLTKYKRILCLALCSVMLLCIAPTGTAIAGSTDDIKADDTEDVDLTEEEEISEYCNLNYEECASSSSGKLFVHYDSGRFYYEDKAGQRWYSNPDMADMDSSAGGIYRMELQSLFIVQYYDISVKQYKKANTETSCVRSGGDVKVTNIEDGFEVLYDFAQIGFKIPLRITIDENGINASVDCTKIVEESPEKWMIYCISLLPYFGAGGPDVEGYIMVADGSGAIMNFNNGSYSKLGYSSHIYGRDISKYLVSKPAESYPITMPVFGIKRANSAVCSIVTAGAAQSTFWCYPNGSISSYANIYAAFDLRETDIVVLSEDTNSASQSTLYQKGDISLDEIAVSYRSITGADADYNGMARVYKEYLTERDDLEIKSQNVGKLSLDFYGAVKKKKSILGFPFTINSPLSKLEDIEDVVIDLIEDGVKDLSITLRDWSREQLSEKIDSSMNPVSVIGKKKDLISLIDTVNDFGGIVNLEAKLNSFKKSGKGYFTWFHSAKSLSNAPIYDYDYYTSNGYKNKSAGRTSYLIPSAIQKMADRVFKKSADIYQNAGISLTGISTSLYSDFNKKDTYNLDETRAKVENAAKTFGSTAVDFPADYIIKYTSLAQNVPVCSTQSDIFDEDIPFVQLVLSGIVSYTVEAVNLSANVKSAILEAAATGSCLQFDLITEEAYSIVGTALDELYDSEAAQLYDEILIYSKYFAGMEEALGECIMVSYKRDGNISKTAYSNGSAIIVDRDNATVKVVSSDGGEYDFTL